MHFNQVAFRFSTEVPASFVVQRPINKTFIFLIGFVCVVVITNMLEAVNLQKTF